jgi:guanylate kinase
MEKRKEPLIIIVSAPSGSGKTTIVNSLLKKVSGMTRTVSYTTRPPRQDEKDGEDYIFISEEEFRKKADMGEFLEWEKNFGSYYGTARAQVDEAIAEGKDIILSIDVKGAKTVKKIRPESISVFIMPPSMDELVSRLRNRRTDREKQVSMRLEESSREMKAADEYDYLVVNDELEEAVNELIAIVESERKIKKDSKTQEKGK